MKSCRVQNDGFAYPTMKLKFLVIPYYLMLNAQLSFLIKSNNN